MDDLLPDGLDSWSVFAVGLVSVKIGETVKTGVLPLSAKVQDSRSFVTKCLTC